MRQLQDELASTCAPVKATHGVCRWTGPLVRHSSRLWALAQLHE